MDLYNGVPPWVGWSCLSRRAPTFCPLGKETDNARYYTRTDTTASDDDDDIGFAAIMRRLNHYCGLLADVANLAYIQADGNYGAFRRLLGEAIVAHDQPIALALAYSAAFHAQLDEDHFRAAALRLRGSAPATGTTTGQGQAGARASTARQAQPASQDDEDDEDDEDDNDNDVQPIVRRHGQGRAGSAVPRTPSSRCRSCSITGSL